MEFEVKDDIFYTKEDLWVREDDGLVMIGITDYAQKRLKAVQYVDLPEEDDDLDRGESFGEVESVKSLSQLIAPVSGRISAVNEQLADQPGLLNSSPYEQGWIIKADCPDLESEKEELMTAQEYLEYRK